MNIKSNFKNSVLDCNHIFVRKKKKDLEKATFLEMKSQLKGDTA